MTVKSKILLIRRKTNHRNKNKKGVYTVQKTEKVSRHQNNEIMI